MPPVAEFVIELASREGRITPTQIAEAEGQRAASAEEFGELPSHGDSKCSRANIQKANSSERLRTWQRRFEREGASLMG